MPRKKTSDLQGDYKAVLGNDRATDVLADLRVFCHATKTTYRDNPVEMARMEGRREVFLRIMSMLKVEFGDVYDYDFDVMDY